MPRPTFVTLLFACALTATACRSAEQASVAGLEPGRAVSGRLAPGDPQFADGSRYRLFPFTGRAGDTITAELVSTDFDANLILTDGHGNRIAANDDGGAHCNARLTHVLPRDGAYRLYANSSTPGEVGAFRVVLRRGGEAAPADTTCTGFGRVAGMIHVGETVEGTLTAHDPIFTRDSTYFQRWVIPVVRGQPFTVDLVSRDFDPYLLLVYGSEPPLLQNDDGGGSCNARLVYVPPDDRPLRILVNTAGKHETGRYTLRVAAGRAVTDPKGECAR